MVNNNTLINVLKLISSCKNGGILKYGFGSSIFDVRLLHNPASWFIKQGWRRSHLMLTNGDLKRADAVTKKIREKKGYVASDENRRVANYLAKLADLGFLKYSDIDGYWGNKTLAAYRRVVNLLTELARLGYLKHSDIDGYWGEKTLAAYLKFKSDLKKLSNLNSLKRILTRLPNNKQTTSLSNYLFVLFKPTFSLFHFPTEDRLNEKVQVPYRR